MTQTKVTIVVQGAPRVNIDGGLVLHRGETIAAVIVDMDSKRCDIDGFNDNTRNGRPLLFIRATPESLHLDETKTGWTSIELPEFAGWEVWMCEVSGYTLRVCLVKPPADEIP